MRNKVWCMGFLASACLLMVSSTLLSQESDAKKPQEDWAKAESTFKEKIFKDTIELQRVKVDVFKEHRFYQLTVKIPQKVHGTEEEIVQTISLGIFALKIDGTAQAVKKLENLAEIAKAEKLKLAKDDDVKPLISICNKLATKESTSVCRFHVYTPDKDQQEPERTVKDIKKEGKSYTAKSVIEVEEYKDFSFIMCISYQYEFKLNDDNELQDITREEKSGYEDYLKKFKEGEFFLMELQKTE